jgi:hypothetical protein
MGGDCDPCLWNFSMVGKEGSKDKWNIDSDLQNFEEKMACEI